VSEKKKELRQAHHLLSAILQMRKEGHREKETCPTFQGTQSSFKFTQFSPLLPNQIAP
jgi:hypothetical protein